MLLEKYLGDKIYDALKLYNGRVNTDGNSEIKEYCKGKLESLVSMKNDLAKMVACPRCSNSFNIVECSLCKGDKVVSEKVAEDYAILDEREKSVYPPLKIGITKDYSAQDYDRDRSEKDVFKATLKKDPINHPDHYIEGGIEAIDIIKAKLTQEQFEGYLLGNVLKYTLRSNYKGRKEEDLSKGKWYLSYLVGLETK